MVHLKTQSGFTLVEMIVALGVFSVVTTITTGAILMLVATNQKFHYEQNIMTNLSFAIDSMTREIRTGYNYYCVSGASPSENPFEGSAHESTAAATLGEVNDNGTLSGLRNDCPSGRPSNNGRMHGVSFFESGNSVTTGANESRILYYYDATRQMIYRRVGNREPSSIISDGVLITEANFFVTGSDSLISDGNRDQPAVTIFMKAKAADDTSTTPREYQLQTTVSQRSLDI